MEPVQEDFVVAKEKIIKTSDILQAFADNTNKLKKTIQAFKELNCRYERLQLENERCNHNCIKAASKNEQLEKENQNLKEKSDSLEQALINANSYLKSLEDEQQLDKEMKKGLDSISPKKNNNSRRHDDLEQELANYKEIEIKQKNELGKLLKENGQLKCSLDKAHEDKRKMLSGIEKDKTKTSQELKKVQYELKLYADMLQQKDKEIQQLNLSLSNMQDLKNRLTYLKSENDRVKKESLLKDKDLEALKRDFKKLNSVSIQTDDNLYHVEKNILKEPDKNSLNNIFQEMTMLPPLLSPIRSPLPHIKIDDTAIDIPDIAINPDESVEETVQNLPEINVSTNISKETAKEKISRKPILKRPIKLPLRKLCKRSKILRKRTSKFKSRKEDGILKLLQELKKSNINFTISNESLSPYCNLLKPCSENKTHLNMTTKIERLSCNSDNCGSSFMLINESDKNEPLLGFFNKQEETNKPLVNKIENKLPIPELNDNLISSSDNILDKLAELVAEKIMKKDNQHSFSVSRTSGYNSEIETELHLEKNSLANRILMEKLREEYSKDQEIDIRSDVTSEVSLSGYLNNFSQGSSKSYHNEEESNDYTKSNHGIDVSASKEDLKEVVEKKDKNLNISIEENILVATNKDKKCLVANLPEHPSENKIDNKIFGGIPTLNYTAVELKEIGRNLNKDLSKTYSSPAKNILIEATVPINSFINVPKDILKEEPENISTNDISEKECLPICQPISDVKLELKENDSDSDLNTKLLTASNNCTSIDKLTDLNKKLVNTSEEKVSINCSSIEEKANGDSVDLFQHALSHEKSQSLLDPIEIDEKCLGVFKEETNQPFSSDCEMIKSKISSTKSEEMDKKVETTNSKLEKALIADTMEIKFKAITPSETNTNTGKNSKNIVILKVEHFKNFKKQYSEDLSIENGQLTPSHFSTPNNKTLEDQLSPSRILTETKTPLLLSPLRDPEDLGINSNFKKIFVNKLLKNESKSKMQTSSLIEKSKTPPTRLQKVVQNTPHKEFANIQISPNADSCISTLLKDDSLMSKEIDSFLNKFDCNDSSLTNTVQSKTSRRLFEDSQLITGKGNDSIVYETSDQLKVLLPSRKYENTNKNIQHSEQSIISNNDITLNIVNDLARIDARNIDAELVSRSSEILLPSISLEPLFSFNDIINESVGTERTDECPTSTEKSIGIISNCPTSPVGSANIILHCPSSPEDSTRIIPDCPASPDASTSIIDDYPASPDASTSIIDDYPASPDNTEETFLVDLSPKIIPLEKIETMEIQTDKDIQGNDIPKSLTSPNKENIASEILSSSSTKETNEITTRKRCYKRRTVSLETSELSIKRRLRSSSRLTDNTATTKSEKQGETYDSLDESGKQNKEQHEINKSPIIETSDSGLNDNERTIVQPRKRKTRLKKIGRHKRINFICSDSESSNEESIDEKTKDVKEEDQDNLKINGDDLGQNQATVPVKRGRGRPRKYTKIDSVTTKEIVSNKLDNPDSITETILPEEVKENSIKDSEKLPKSPRSKKKVTKLQSKIRSQMKQKQLIFQKPVVPNISENVNHGVKDSSLNGISSIKETINTKVKETSNLEVNIHRKVAPSQISNPPVNTMESNLKRAQPQPSCSKKKLPFKNRKAISDILSQIIQDMNSNKPQKKVMKTVIKKDIPNDIGLKDWRKNILEIAELTHDVNNVDLSGLYGLQPYKTKRSGILMKDAVVPRKIKFLIKKLIGISTDDIPEPILLEFKRLPINDIIDIIIYYVSRDINVAPSTEYYPAPLMTKTQRIFLKLLVRLEKEKGFETILELFLFKTHEFVVRIGCGIRSTVPLTRLFLSLCRLHGKVNRMRIFCCEAFFYRGNLAIPIFFTVLTSWPDIIPLETNLNTFPLAKVLVQIVHLKVFSAPGYNLFPLKCLLSQYHGYPKERWNCDEVFEELFKSFTVAPSLLTDYSIRLFCKNKDTQFVYKKINEFFKPWIYKIPTENVKLKAASIILIGKLCRSFKPRVKKEQKFLMEMKRWFEDLLEDADIDPIVEQSISTSLEHLPMKGKKYYEQHYFDKNQPITNVIQDK